MAIEAEFYSYNNKGKRRNKPTFNGEVFIRPGSSEVINYLPPGVLVTLDVENSRGTVVVRRNSSNNLSARLYKDEDDETGVTLDPSKPMELKKGEELVLGRREKRTSREIFLLLPTDEDGDDVTIPSGFEPATI